MNIYNYEDEADMKSYVIKQETIRIIQNRIRLNDQIMGMESIDIPDEKIDELNTILNVDLGRSINLGKQIDKLKKERDQIDVKLNKIMNLGVFDWDELEHQALSTLGVDTEIHNTRYIDSIMFNANKNDNIVERYLIMKNLWLTSDNTVRLYLERLYMKPRISDLITSVIKSINVAILAKNYKEAWSGIKLMCPVKAENWPGIMKLTKSGYILFDSPADEFSGTIWQYIGFLANKLRSNNPSREER